MDAKKVKNKKKTKPSRIHDGEDTRIGRLDAHTLGYYRRISETVDSVFETPEEQDIFLNNVMKQLSSEVMKVSQNQTVSTIVEKLVQKARPKQLQDILHSVAQDWETACCDRFASHVTQALIYRAGSLISSPKICEDEDAKGALQTDIMSLWNFLQSSVGVYMQHTYASHVLRTLIEVLGDMEVSDSVLRSRLSQQYKKSDKPDKQSSIKYCSPTVSAEKLELLESFTKKILSFPKLKDYLIHALSNPVVQTLLLVLKKRLPQSCEELCKGMLPLCFQVEEESITGLVNEVIGSRLVEQILSVCTAEMFEELFIEYIKGNLAQMALHRVANFVVQKIITSSTKEQFERIYKELRTIFEDLLAHYHIGVLDKLAEAAITHGTKQEKLIKSLMKAFHCYKPEERQFKIVPLIASLTTYDVYYKLPDEKDDKDDIEDAEKDADSDDEVIAMPTLKDINLHGSILLQKLLLFGNPRLIVQSLLELSPTELTTLACDSKGSHIIDAFLKSAAVGEKSREQLHKKLNGCFINIACSKCGSRAIESLWRKSSLKQKIVIAEELMKQQDKVRGHSFGHFVWRSFALDHFVTRRQEWKNIQTGALKKQGLFKDIIGGNDSQRKRKSSGFNGGGSEEYGDMDQNEKQVSEIDCDEGKPIHKKQRKEHKNSDQDNLPGGKKLIKSSSKYNKYEIKDKSMQQLLEKIKPRPKKNFKTKK